MKDPPKLGPYIYLLYTLFSLNNHFIFFFIISTSLVNPTFSLFFAEHYSLCLSFSYTVNFLSFSSFSHLSSLIKINFFLFYKNIFTKHLHVYLLYTLFYLNNHFIFFFIISTSLVNPTFSLFFVEHYSLCLSFSHTVNFLSFSSFSHLSSPIKFYSFAPFFTRKLH